MSLLPLIDFPSPIRPRILVTRADRLGDLVLSTPVLQALREKIPEAWITLLTFQENREAAEGNPFLNELILYDKKGRERSGWGQWRMARRLAAGHFDLVVHLHATNRMHLLTWLAGIPVRIGWRRKSAWALTHAFDDIKKEGLKHEALYNFDLLAPLGVEPPKTGLRSFFPLTEKNRRSFDELSRHQRIADTKSWVILNPSASCPSKIWPAERFGELAERIIARYPVELIAIGSRADRIFVERMRRASKVSIHDLSGSLSLGMLGVLLSRAALLISNDSGPVHVANAVGTPAISIFGRKQPGLSPRRWGPLDPLSRVVWKDVGCTECLAHNCQIQFLCLDAISVNAVFLEILGLEDRLMRGEIPS